MRAKLIYEKFTKNSDPIEDMDIGNPEKALFPEFVKELEALDISVEWGKDNYMGPGFWWFEIDLSDADDDYELRGEELPRVQLSYATDKAAKEEEEEDEDCEGGWALYNEDGDDELTPITHDTKLIIKTLLNIKYKNKKYVITKIQDLQETLAKLQNAIKFM